MIDLKTYNFSPEEELCHKICLVFLQSQKPADLNQFFEDHKIDWNKGLPLINQQKLPLLAFALFRQISLGHKFPRILNYLQKVIKSKNKHKQLMRTEFVKVQSAFKEKGITVLPYKGMILSHKYYDNPNLRSSVDIDLAISEHDLGASMDIMSSMDYILHKENRTHQDITKLRSYDIDFSWIRNDEDGNMICNTELHWQPSHNVLWLPLKFDQIMDQTESLNIGGQQVTAFQNDIHNVLVIIHHGLVDGWGQLRHLVDFALILKKSDPSEIERLTTLCREHKVLNTFYTGVALVSLLFDIHMDSIKIPNHVTKLATLMAPKILKNELSAKWSEQKVKVKYYLKMRDSFSDRVRSVAMLLKFLYIEKRTQYLA